MWKDTAPLYAHLLYNPERELKERNELYAHAAWLKEKIEAGKKLPAYREDIEKYVSILIENSKNGKPRVTIRQDVIDEELATSGWVILIGNGDISTQKAHDIYRKKDVVEKGFLKYKNSLGLNRLRLHEGERMKNKLFVAFVALILLSHIHKVMKEKDLYRQMTMDQLFLILSKLKIVAIDGHNILRPITKEQAELFSRFSIPLPRVG
jgi:transposase